MIVELQLMLQNRTCVSTIIVAIIVAAVVATAVKSLAVG